MASVPRSIWVRMARRVGEGSALRGGCLALMAAVWMGGSARAQEFQLPDDRRVAWQPGIPGGIPAVGGPSNDVVSFGADPTGFRSAQQAFEAALAAAATGPSRVVYVPPGAYLLTNGIFLSSGVVLRGAGPQSRLVFRSDSNGQGRAIGLLTWDKDQRAATNLLRRAAARGDDAIEVDDAAGYAPGDVICVWQDNPDGWGAHADGASCGQVAEVVAARPEEDRLVLRHALRAAYTPGRRARVQKMDAIVGAGVENLGVVLEGPGEWHSIELKHAVRCWVRGVESRQTMRAHVWLEHSFACEVRACSLQYAQNYGGLGHGYGVGLGRHASDNLVEDNVLAHLRHALIAGHGANGNVIAYNYSTEQEAARGQRAQPDLCVHGNYAHANLFEGNVAQDADFPDGEFWPSGPANTLFRNELQRGGYGVLVRANGPGEAGQSVVGNHLRRGTLRVDDGVRNAFCHGNRVDDEVVWSDGAGRDLPASLFRGRRPPFFEEAGASFAWPPIGPDRTPQAGDAIPAARRYRLSIPER